MNNVILPEGYVPSEQEEYMNPRQVQYFKEKLLKWREELIQESNETIKHLKEENWNDADLTDRASMEIEVRIELRTRDRYRKLLNKIDIALEKIKNNEYGYCEETGEEIGLKRLEARPTAALCIEAQERYEKYERQHLDEEDKERQL